MNTINIQARRDKLALMFRDFKYKVGAEIGVDRGIYSEMICQLNKKVKLYCIDPWKDYEGYNDIKGQENFDVRYKETVERLKPYNCEIIRKTSMEAIKNFKKGSLDFVYIDGNHSYESVLDDLNAWSKVVKKGGTISGHDYKNELSTHGNEGVTKAVNEYLKENNIKEFFVFVKRRDSSWMFENK